MQNPVLQLLMTSLLVLPVGVLSAQEPQADAPNQGVIEDSKEVPDEAGLVPLMSAAEDLPESAVLASGSPYEALAAGVCPVVEDLVAQFCAANPDDISCQFQ